MLTHRKLNQPKERAHRNCGDPSTRSAGAAGTGNGSVGNGRRCNAMAAVFLTRRPMRCGGRGPRGGAARSRSSGVGRRRPTEERDDAESCSQAALFTPVQQEDPGTGSRGADRMRRARSPLHTLPPGRKHV